MRLLFTPLLLAAALLGSGATATAFAAAPADTTAVASAFATWTAVWRDAARARDVPVKIYYPAAATPEKLPVILFSHGLGGTREGYSYLGEYWAARGYISLHVQHAGSDDAVWRDARRPIKAMRDATTDPQAVRARPRDLVFALDQLEKLAADPSFILHDRLDLTRVGAAGHSFGAFTVMTLTGWQPGAPGLAVNDPRIKAVVALSTPAARRDSAETSGYASVRLPVLHFTGTEDTDQVGGASDAAWRRIPFDRTTAAPAWLVTLEGGDHMVFGGPLGGEGSGKRDGLLARRRDASRDPEFHALVQTATTRFWDALLKNEADARAWIDGPGLTAAAGPLAKVERKPAPAP